MEIFAPPLNLGRNRLINGNFAINQRGYVSGGSLGSNAFGHDRWRDSVGGSSYTFTQASQAPGNAHSIDTTITITSGQLTNPVEFTEGGTFVLSWTGTSVANLTGTSGITGPSTGLTSPAVVTLAAGVTVYVNFGPGTLGLVQLESGTTPTPFERRPIGLELALCQRYFQTGYGSGVAPGTANAVPSFSCISSGSSYQPVASFAFPVTMRAIPTVTTYSPFSGTAGKIGRNAYQTQDVPSYNQAVSNSTVTIGVQNTTTNNGEFLVLNYTLSAEL